MNNPLGVPAHRHTNPDESEGGWVADTATVAATAHIGPNAQVLDNARVSDDARVSDNARVFGNARVSGTAWVSDHAWVSGNARVSGTAWVFGNAWVSGTAWVFGNARVFGTAWVFGNARVQSDDDYICLIDKGLAFTAFRTQDGWHIPEAAPDWFAEAVRARQVEQAVCPTCGRIADLARTKGFPTSDVLVSPTPKEPTP